MTIPTALGCDRARVALSCRMDGEEPVVSPSRLKAHLEMCVGCRAWLSRADELARLLSAQPAQAPDLAEATLKAVTADQTDPGACGSINARRVGWPRTTGTLAFRRLERLSCKSVSRR
jgi:predicted anti-sigma-YlaC factor YlaD